MVLGMIVRVPVVTGVIVGVRPRWLIIMGSRLNTIKGEATAPRIRLIMRSMLVRTRHVLLRSISLHYSREQ
jgi:hypothetical protein